MWNTFKVRKARLEVIGLESLPEDVQLVEDEDEGCALQEVVMSHLVECLKTVGHVVLHTHTVHTYT